MFLIVSGPCSMLNSLWHRRATTSIKAWFSSTRRSAVAGSETEKFIDALMSVDLNDHVYSYDDLMTGLWQSKSARPATETRVELDAFVACRSLAQSKSNGTRLPSIQ